MKKNHFLFQNCDRLFLTLLSCQLSSGLVLLCGDDNTHPQTGQLAPQHCIVGNTYRRQRHENTEQEVAAGSVQVAFFEFQYGIVRYLSLAGANISCNCTSTK